MIREKQPTWALTKAILKVKELLTEFLDVLRKPHRDVRLRCPIRGNPPSEGMYKVNFDRGIFSEFSLAIGVVIRFLWDDSILVGM
nr:hypothetical protein CFP56_44838 [Quercus suber]